MSKFLDRASPALLRSFKHFSGDSSFRDFSGELGTCQGIATEVDNEYRARSANPMTYQQMDGNANKVFTHFVYVDTVPPDDTEFIDVPEVGVYSDVRRFRVVDPPQSYGILWMVGCNYADS